MTNTEAIKELERQKVMFCHNCVHPQMVGWCENHCQIPEAYDMAINALKAQEKSQEVSNNSPELDKENGELISRKTAIEEIKAVFEWHDTVTMERMIEHFNNLPSAQPEQTNSWCINSWCNNCKEYDTENKCCPRYSRIIKQTLDDAYRHGETEAEGGSE